MQDLEGILLLYGIDFSSELVVRPLYSRINNVFLIQNNNKKVVLKEFLKLSSDEIKKQQEIIEDLIKLGIKIPKILKNRNNETFTILNNSSYEITEYIDHVDLSDQLTINQGQLNLAGRTLGEIHKTINIPLVSDKLQKQDFIGIAEKTFKEIIHFKNNFSTISSKATEDEKQKLSLLKEIIGKTDIYRERGLDEFANFFNQPFVPTHGDYSMLNVLVTPKEELYVIDWDNMKLRPLVWDLQAGMSLFSCRYKGNAYLVEPDQAKLETFLKAYLQKNPLTKDQLLLLPEVAKYNFAIYWLSYTLPAVNKYDFRLLDLIPESIDKALYWPRHYEAYKQFINTVKV